VVGEAGLDADLDLALALADAADALTMAVYTGGALEFTAKDDGTPVTETDRLVEATLRSMVHERRPEDGFLGEESGRSGPSARQWIVDPIDGTESFAAGGRNWGTQIALVVDGRPVVGTTSAPAVAARWWAGAAGAFARRWDEQDARRLGVTDRPGLPEATWICHPPPAELDGHWRVLAERLAGACGERARVVSHGALMVAEGRLDVCLTLEGAAWDYAAFAAIVEAAGGRFSYLDGSADLGGVRPALFTNGRLHDDALAALGG
jgi:histidinol-phosphatase